MIGTFIWFSNSWVIFFFIISNNSIIIYERFGNNYLIKISLYIWHHFHKNYFKWNVILYHKKNLVYTVDFLQFLIFQQDNSAQTQVLIFFSSRHYYFVEKLKIVEKQLCKLNCSYGKVIFFGKMFT